ncbi:MAG: hypothetical protein LBD87_01200 [Prevotellaceae bacterium]|nr:hypothetical protein [Prevotellaceae bacterium]
MRTKIFFLFAMLASVAASAQVTNVEPVGANYANKTVSFRVWWDAGSRDTTHLSKVWVWVDYITVNSNNTTSGNTWTRATVGTISPATGVSYDGSNRNGFWLEGNVSTDYSATLTVSLTNVPAKFNWCAYVSDYPPNVTAANGTYTFKGTPPFTLIATDGATQPVTGKTLAVSALTITPTTIKDKTECPGVFCIYSGSDLYMDATHLCQQRTTGAQNWEAYIQDTRDNQIYRITQFSDGSWWFADDFNINENVKATCDGKRYYSTKNNPSCPTDWMLPTTADAKNRWNPNPITDDYGGKIDIGYAPYENAPCYVDWGGRYDILVTDCGIYGALLCYHNRGYWLCNSVIDVWGRMRCWRQL